MPVRRLGFDGSELASATVSFASQARQSTLVTLPADVATAGDPGGEVLVEGEGAGRAVWWWAEDVDLPLEQRWADVRVEPTDQGFSVHVTAEALAKDVCLLVDKAHPDAAVDDALVTLLPGESHTFTVRCPSDVDPDALTTPRVLRSAGQLVAGRTSAAGRSRA